MENYPKKGIENYLKNRIENYPKNRIENYPKKRIENYPSHMARAFICRLKLDESIEIHRVYVSNIKGGPFCSGLIFINTG